MVPLSSAYVVREQGILVLGSACGDLLKRAYTSVPDDTGRTEVRQWEIVAEAQGSTRILVNQDNPGYRTLHRWSSAPPDRIAVSFALANGFDTGFLITQSEIAEGHLVAQGVDAGPEERAAALERLRKQRC